MTDPTLEIANSVAKPLVLKAVDALIRPILTTARFVSDPLTDQFTNRFSEYLTRQYLKHSFLPSIVFQKRKALEELYIPVTLETESNIQQLDGKDSYKIDGFNKDFIPKLKRILVIDDAGMGKSTLSRYLLIQATKILEVPVFIELRHLSTSRTIIDLILSELNPAGITAEDMKIDKRNFIRLLNKGIFTFFLDGYDEISLKDREKVTIDIKYFADTYSNNNFLITSRPENALVSFSSFYTFKIKPLELEEAFLLIQKYDSNGENSKKLIEKLKDKSLKGAYEFLKNPLLTTLLYRAYDYKHLIPFKKPGFYRQVFDALYDWHDATKDGYSTREKSSGLDIDGFHKILRGIGFISTMTNKVETDRDGILKWIREARTYAPELQFSESDFLEDAIKAVPLFRREGNAILWSHKSMAEYFAAQFIISDAKKDQERICNSIAQSRSVASYYNLLEMIYDIDIDVFNIYFTKPLLNLYKDYATKLYQQYPNISENIIKKRASMTFGNKFMNYGETKGDHDKYSTKIIRALQKLQKQAAKDWFSIENDPEFAYGSSMKIQVVRTQDLKVTNQTIVRFIKINHPLMTIFDILKEKKSNLIFNRAFLNINKNQVKIIGIRQASMLQIDDLPSSIWNNPKHFDQTTDALINASETTLNLEKIEVIEREIDQRTGSSMITANLLNSLLK